MSYSQSNNKKSLLYKENLKMFLENTVNHKEQFGWIEVICGSMFSGKTEELIRRLRRAQFAKQKVEIFKPSVDTRYDEVMVVSHNKNEIRSSPVPAAANISDETVADFFGLDNVDREHIKSLHRREYKRFIV